MKRRILIGIAVIVGILLLSGVALAIWAFSQPEFPSPSGPYAVGTMELAFVDSNRIEQLGAEPGGARKIGVRIWYPASADATGQRLPIIDGRVSKAFGELYQAPFGDEDGAPSAAILNAPSLAGTERFPVVLFSHGGFSHRGQNLSTMQELASHGFIAIAIGHTHESILALLPKGEAVEIDPKLASGMSAFTAGNEILEIDYAAAIAQMQSAADKQAGLSAAREFGNVMAQMFKPLGHTPASLLKIRHGDITFVHTKLSELDADPDHPLNGRYNLAQVGVFGHSMGGLTSVSVCLDRSIPIQACLNLDAPYFLSGDAPLPRLERPLLHAYSESTKLPTGQQVSLAGSNRFLNHHATVNPVSLVVAGTSHMNFSDMNFLPRVLKLVGVLGSLDGGRSAAINNDLTVSFFRHHLKNEPQPWLEQPQTRYKEVAKR